MYMCMKYEVVQVYAYWERGVNIHAGNSSGSERSSSDTVIGDTTSGSKGHM